MKTRITILFAACMIAMILAPANAEVFQYSANGYTGSEDMFLWENTYGNQGGQPEIRSYNNTVTDEMTTGYIPVVKFDLSSIASGSPVGSATLKLWVTANTTGQLAAGSWTAHEMLDAVGFGVATDIWIPEVGTASHWAKNIVSLDPEMVTEPWATGYYSYYGGAEGASYGPLPGTNYAATGAPSSALSAAVGVWLEIDITAMVQGWIDNPSANNGLLILDHHPTNSNLAYFASNEDPTVANRPILDVNVIPEPGMMSLGVLLLTALKLRKK
jgi:hypothetical protein